MPIVVESTDHHYDNVLVWDRIAGAIRPYGAAQVRITDPISDVPLMVLWEGVEVSTIYTDWHGRATFVAQQGSVKLNARNLSVVVESIEQQSY